MNRGTLILQSYRNMPLSSLTDLFLHYPTVPYMGAELSDTSIHSLRKYNS